MKKSLMTTILIAGIVSLGTAGASFADDDDCTVPMADWQPREAVQKMAEGRGWTVRRIKTDDGCYEIKGRDAQGRELKAKIDPGTLAIVEMKLKNDDDHDDDDDDDDDRDAGRKAAPAGPVAPPDNGLFNRGAKPGVVIN